VREGVALEADGRRQVARAVALDVVVLDVVVVVRVPGVAHEGVHDVGEEVVDEGEAAGEHAALVDVLVLEQGVGSHVVALHGDVEDGVQVGEAGEEEDGGGDRGGEVEEEVRDEDDVRFDTAGGARPGDVGGQQAVEDAG